MRLLVLDGTLFFGPPRGGCGPARGHGLTLFNRGRTDPQPITRVEQIYGDRERDLSRLAGRSWDAVIDTSGYLPRVMGASVLAHYAELKAACERRLDVVLPGRALVIRPGLIVGARSHRTLLDWTPPTRDDWPPAAGCSLPARRTSPSS